MPSIPIGRTAAGGRVELDLVKLIDSRALIQANSGGGKSYLLRLIAEQAGKNVQLVIIDPEGEFATLRERLDLILVGQSGEIPANPRTAAPLARRLAEAGSSAVIDLSEIDLGQRRSFVRQFLTALIDVPRSLWHPLLLAIDEAHLFAPERSAGDAESTAAVIQLMTLGRKRGFAGILATQRISKLHKDAAAEANNVFVGRTALDVDQKRAADSLGMGKADHQTLRDLAAGEWFAFGPAIDLPGVTRFHADQCKTTHPKAGERHKLKPPPPSTAVRGLVAEMADLSNRDPDEALTLDEAQGIIARLKGESRAKDRQLAAKPSGQADPQALEKARAAGEAAGAAARDREIRPLIVERDRIIGALTGKLGRGHKAASELAALLVANGEATSTPVPAFRESRNSGSNKTAATLQPVTSGQVASAKGNQPVKHDRNHARADTGDLPKGEAAVLSALIQFPDGLRREQLTVLTGYKRSSRDAYIQRLREKGLVDAHADGARATEAGIAALPNAQPLPTGAELQAYWLARLPLGERAILEQLIAAYPEPVSRDALSDATGYQRSSRDAYLQRMRAKQLIEEPGRGTVRASENLF